MMVMSRISVLGFLLLAAGCAGMEKAPPADAAAKPAREEPVASKQEAPPAPTPIGPAAPVAKPDVPVASAPAATPAPAPIGPAAPVAKPDVPVASAPATTAAPPEPVAKNDVIVPPAPKPAPATKPAAPPAAPPAAKPAPPPAAKPPPLDLALLEKRIKETSAVGVLTKLTLKNQVDDLLERFKAHYDGRAKTTLAQLRQPYESLIFKVLAALQDGDPSLAKAVADSREAIWAILSDPDKFRNL